MTIKIIGIGSPFGDDTLAYHAIQALREHALIQSSPNAITIDYLDRPGVSLLEDMRGFDRVYLIDAIVCDKPVGEILRLEKADITFSTSNISTHTFALSDTLRLGDTLDCLPAQLVLYGIAIEKPSSPLHLSEKILSTLPNMLNTLVDEITAKQSHPVSMIP